jgi:DNA polymerase-1
MYLPVNLERYWAVDIEGDSLQATKVHCCVAINCKTRETREMTRYDEIAAFFAEEKAKGSKFVGHNIIGYDAPTLNRLVGTRLTISDIIDTMVMSMVYSPSFSGGHSLDNWGSKLGMPKGEFNDFSAFSPEMLRYCVQDTLICREIFIRLVKRMRDIRFTEEGLELEHRSWALIKKQQDNGFAFNEKEANILYAILRQREDTLKEKIYEYWPPRNQKVATYSRPFKKDGSRTANFTRHLQQYRDVRVSDCGTFYDCYDLVYFNIGSPSQRIEKLLELGWEPREFTKPSKTHPNGQPQATVKGQLSPSLVEFVEKSGKDEVRLIAEWIEINARANMINTWLEAYNHDTGCIHGSLWLANTLRYRHSNPNTANIPGVRHSKEGPLLGELGKWTYEARALWTVRNPVDRCLVGVDAKGIQLRVLAHYLDNKEFTDVVINGDPHSYNQALGEFATRDIAKTFIYAFFLGAGDAKIGQIAGGTTKDGRDLKRKFIDRTPGLKRLLDDLKRQVERTGRIVLCDGTPVIVDKPHTVLAYLLQGDESRIMKKAAILADREIRRRKLDVLKVGDIHDEWQSDVLRDHAEEFANSVCPDSFAAAGTSFNYRVPIGCSAHIGMNWAETH